MSKVVVTRPGKPGEELVALLAEQLPMDCQHIPLLDIQPLKPRAIPWHAVDIVIVTSQHALKETACFMDATEQDFARIEWLAVGEASANALVAMLKRVATRKPHLSDTLHPPEVIHPEIQSSEGLLALPSLSAPSVQQKQVIILKGAGGRTLLRDNLTERYASVTEIICYRRVPSVLSPNDLRSLYHASLTVISSIEIFWCFHHAVEQAYPEREAIRHSPGPNRRLLCLSERIAATASQSGYQTILCPNPSNHCIIETLKQQPASG